MALEIKEQTILNQILEFLMMKNIMHAHVRNTGSIIKRNGQTFFAKPKFKQKGVADILGCFKGKAFAIEVKSETGRVSEDQINWLKNWEAAGGCFIVTRNIEQVVRFIESLERMP